MDPQYQEAARLHQAGNIVAAARLYQEILMRNPRDVQAMCSLAYCCFQTGKFEEAQRLFGAALTVAPSDVNALCIRGVALMHLQRRDQALALFDAALALRPDFPEAITNRGTALMEMGRLDEALAEFDRALGIAPGDANTLNNRGNALLQLGRPAEALASYERALSIDSSHVEALFNRGNALTELLRLKEALTSYDRALSLRPSYAEAWYRRGIALLWLKQPAEAEASLSRALTIAPALSRPVLRARSQAFFQLRRYPEAIADSEALLRIDPDAPYVRGQASHWRRCICDWTSWEKDKKDRLEAIPAGKPFLNPWVALSACDDPAEQLHWSRLWARDIAAQSPSLPAAARRDGERIRIAYLSGDLHDHVIAKLMIEIFEHHDRRRFETFAVSFESGGSDGLGTRLEGAFDRVIDVSGKRDEDVAVQLRELGIDIAIDLMGYTMDSRPGILARRPAPVQVSYLGFAGTMGAPWIDYLIADRIVIPAEDRMQYDECIAYLPKTYQPYDSATPPGGPLPTRAEAGLPETGFVFCAFNNSYKITPDVFAVWMRLLAAVPGSVLWLREKNFSVAASLRNEAEKRGVSAQRLIFAPVLPGRNEYRARLGLADLFLDTLPYNAHTTAADALWAGVPVLTCTGKTLAGRVATSILNACGLSESAVASLAEYEALALKLAGDLETLARLREKVHLARRNSPLFDSAGMCRNLEAAYAAMWDTYRRGEKPSDIAVTPIGP